MEQIIKQSTDILTQLEIVRNEIVEMRKLFHSGNATQKQMELAVDSRFVASFERMEKTLNDFSSRAKDIVKV